MLAGSGLLPRAEYWAFSSLIGAFLHPELSLAEDSYFGSFFTTSGVPCRSSVSSLFELLWKNLKNTV
jgi:hypothetical protein